MSHDLPDPHNTPELFDSVLSRRVVAYLIDLSFLGMIVAGITIIGFVSGFLSLGIGWLLTPVAVIIALVAYYALTLGSERRATIGMSMMDLVLTRTRGAPLDGFGAFLHPLLFWVTFWISWPVSLLLPLFTPRQQMLHDLVLGMLVVRRSPMVDHWRATGATVNRT